MFHNRELLLGVVANTLVKNVEKIPTAKYRGLKKGMLEICCSRVERPGQVSRVGIEPVMIQITDYRLPNGPVNAPLCTCTFLT